MPIEVRHHVEVVIWPYENRVGEVLDIGEDEHGKPVYNLWMTDDNQILAFEAWEVKSLES